MHRDKRISVILPAYNEAPGIVDAVQGFRERPEVDEVLVVDNNSRDGTGELARKSGARVIVEERQGYGYACRRGLQEADSDLLFIAEPDGTFDPQDISRFLPYCEAYDAVFGTRTSKGWIARGANMGFSIRWGNVLVAKYLQWLYRGPNLSDVGCTFKMLSKKAALAIAPSLTVGGSHFSPELMIALIRHRFRCIEIPVHYRKRVGISKITGKKLRAMRVALRMIWLITRWRSQTIRTNPHILHLR
jgi:glycosyltransferase involved in cell wall biosynthesis